ncbi:MAG TPA: hypothetical protein VJA40_01805 [archaeon]|nr:hypothetical protein [archaeon]
MERETIEQVVARLEPHKKDFTQDQVRSVLRQAGYAEGEVSVVLSRLYPPLAAPSTLPSLPGYPAPTPPTPSVELVAKKPEPKSQAQAAAPLPAPSVKEIVKGFSVQSDEDVKALMAPETYAQHPAKNSQLVLPMWAKIILFLLIFAAVFVGFLVFLGVL